MEWDKKGSSRLKRKIEEEWWDEVRQRFFCAVVVALSLLIVSLALLFVVALHVAHSASSSVSFAPSKHLSSAQ